MIHLINKDMEQYLHEIKIPIRLSFLNKSGWPMIVSLWFVYEDGKLKCATKENAFVVKCLQNEPRCGFEIAADILPYCGIRGRAQAIINKKDGVRILRILLNRYLGSENSSIAKLLLKQSSEEVAIELIPENLFSWNFNKRMEDAVSEKRSLLCP